MRLIKVLTLVLVFSMLCTSSMCSSDEPKQKLSIILENNSEGKAWFRTSIFNIEKDSYILLEKNGFAIVNQNKTETYMVYIPGEYKNLYFEFMVINEQNVKDYTHEELIKYEIYDKKYFMSYNELKSLNFKITYSDDK